MQFKQKLVYMALGSLFTLAGYLLASTVGNVTAQTKKAPVEFDEVVCNTLTVKGSLVLEGGLLGKTVIDGARMTSTFKDEITEIWGSFVKVSREGGNELAMISVDREGGSVLVRSKDGRSSAAMSARDVEPLIGGGSRSRIEADSSNNGNDYRASLEARVGSLGSSTISAFHLSDEFGKRAVNRIDINVSQNDRGSIYLGESGVSRNEGYYEDKRVSIGVDEYGGKVSVFGKGNDREHPTVVIGATPYGGMVTVRGKGNDEKHAQAEMAIGTNDEGIVAVHGKGNPKASAAIGVNDYGNGAISAWDKNGKRIK